MNERAIFVAALGRAPNERDELVSEACGTDEQLRNRIEILLAAHESDGRLLAGPFERTDDVRSWQRILALLNLLPPVNHSATSH